MATLLDFAALCNASAISRRVHTLRKLTFILIILANLPACATNMLHSYIQEKPAAVMVEPAKRIDFQIEKIIRAAVYHKKFSSEINICVQASMLEKELVTEEKWEEYKPAAQTVKFAEPTTYQISLPQYYPGDLTLWNFQRIDQGCHLPDDILTNMPNFVPIPILETQPPIQDKLYAEELTSRTATTEKSEMKGIAEEYLIPGDSKLPTNYFYYITPMKKPDGSLVSKRNKIEIAPNRKQAIYRTEASANKRKLLLIFIPVTLMIDIVTAPAQLLFFALYPPH